MAFKTKKLIPISVYRLIPAAISSIATLLMIKFIGSTSYGGVSLLLATGSLCNTILFHWSRNLIVFRTHFKITDEDLKNAWASSLILAPALISIFFFLGKINRWEMLLLMIYLFSQSIYERKVEFLRSSLNLKHFLIVGCGRPILNVIFISLMAMFLPFDGAVEVGFFCLAISPFLATLFTASPLKVNSFQLSFKRTLKIMPLGILITVPLSYLFLQEAIIKLTIVDIIGSYPFGLYASFSDITLPASWVLVSAITWDYIPRAVKSDLGELNKLLLNKLMTILIPSAVCILGIYLAIHFELETLIGIKLNNIPQFIGLFSNQLVSAILANLILTSLILKGKRVAAFLIILVTILGMVATLKMQKENDLSFIWSVLIINVIGSISALIWLYQSSFRSRLR